jgi:exodeoxyribonuclease VII large subunit
MDSAFTLQQLLNSVKSFFDKEFYSHIWVDSELSDWKKNHFSQHVYGELIEHNASGKKVASCRFTCWKYQAASIESKFYQQTGENLKKGLKVRLKCKLVFSEQYGFSINIIDIDTHFTLGLLYSNIHKIYCALENEGVQDINKNIEAIYDFFNVAVISSPTAAGVDDFKEISDKLSKDGLCQFKFFDSLMQGNGCVENIIEALRFIQTKNDNFDCVVILRGGGSVLDLAIFNDYDLAKEICLYKIPVYTAIGHDKDQSVLDMVSHLSFGTPSKVASYIKDTIYNKGRMTSDFIDFIESKTSQLLINSFKNIELLSTAILASSNKCVQLSESTLGHYGDKVKLCFNDKLYAAGNHIEKQFKYILANSLTSTLTKGYTIALDESNNVIKSKTEAKSASIKKLKFKDGDFIL